jgi:hypothetical protein
MSGWRGIHSCVVWIEGGAGKLDGWDVYKLWLGVPLLNNKTHIFGLYIIFVRVRDWLVQVILFRARDERWERWGTWSCDCTNSAFIIFKQVSIGVTIHMMVGVFGPNFYSLCHRRNQRNSPFQARSDR